MHIIILLPSKIPERSYYMWSISGPYSNDATLFLTRFIPTLTFCPNTLREKYISTYSMNPSIAVVDGVIDLILSIYAIDCFDCILSDSFKDDCWWTMSNTGIGNPENEHIGGKPSRLKCSSLLLSHRPKPSRVMREWGFEWCIQTSNSVVFSVCRDCLLYCAQWSAWRRNG